MDIKIQPTDWNIIGSKYNVKKGDRLILMGDVRDAIQFVDLPYDVTVIADKALKIMTTNTGGRAVIFSNCQGPKILGNNGPIEITGAAAQGVDFRDKSSNVEAAYLYIHDLLYGGLFAKTDPTCDPTTWRKTDANPNGFVLNGAWWHHNKIVNMRDGEGGYLGESHHATFFPLTCSGKAIQALEHDVLNAIVEDNEIINVGADGLQMGAVVDGLICRRNRVTNFGIKGVYGQSSGIQFNPGSVGECYDNYINGGTSYGIIMQGPGLSKVYRNVVVNTAGGIMAVARGGSKGTFEIFNNTLIDISGVGVEHYNDVNFKNNVLHMKSGSYFKSYGGKLVDTNNYKVTGANALLLDGNYVPTEVSPVPKGIGIADYVKPVPKTITEDGSITIETTEGVSRVYARAGEKKIELQTK